MSLLRERLVAAGAMLGLAAILLSRVPTCHSARAPDRVVLVTEHARFTPGPGGRVTLEAAGADGPRVLGVGLTVGTRARPLELVSTGAGALGAELEVEDDGVRATVSVTATVDAHADALVLALSVRPADGAPAALAGDGHPVAVHVDLPSEGRRLFISGSGELADVGAAHGSFAIWEDRDRPLVIVAPAPVATGVVAEARWSAAPGAETAVDPDEPPEGEEAGERTLRFGVGGAPLVLERAGTAELRVLVTPSLRAAYRSAWEAVGEEIAVVRGAVTGPQRGARVVGLAADATHRVRFPVQSDGTFEMDVSRHVHQWIAIDAEGRSSAPVLFPAGSPGEVRLEIVEAGTLSVRVVDGDTKRPVPARVIVRGEGGTVDPSFGPDFRASGAGPLVDTVRGEVETPLPAGRYRVFATRGIEWSIDAAPVVIEPGKRAEVALELRHVVPTPDLVGCDLHVHARPSFDTPVSVEDRVQSLVAAGVDFAVPTEHNLVGDYGPSLAVLDLSSELAFVPGVEVTTFSPRLGHFGVFPWPVDAGPPPFRKSSMARIFAAVRADPARVIQVNHPRLPKGIGYFELARFPQDGGAPPRTMRTDFDLIEVYSGYDLAAPARVEQVMRDWFTLLSAGHRMVATGSSDSHSIQYQWAGYPRTMVALPERPGPLDVAALVLSLRQGHAQATSGPIIELEVAGGRPGDEVEASADRSVAVHVRVRAAPWIDVSSVDLVVGRKGTGVVAETLDVASRPLTVGREPGTLAEAQARTLRLDASTRIDVGKGSTWVLAVARGTRRMDDVLPFMPVAPLALTNPVWIR
jgi:predicted metal-dependent phosphoesterase TrpH